MLNKGNRNYRNITWMFPIGPTNISCIFIRLVISSQLWRKYMKSAGSDDNGLLTPSILIESLDQQRNNPEFKKVFLTFTNQIFGVLDLNGDGYLSEDELARGFDALGVQDTSFVHNTFEYMDLNKDGKLSIEEFSHAFLQYLITEDEHLLFGPLV